VPRSDVDMISHFPSKHMTGEEKFEVQFYRVWFLISNTAVKLEAELTPAVKLLEISLRLVCLHFDLDLGIYNYIR